jgi:hypothetical protein
MRYVIDGYNLLHAVGLLRGRAGPHGLEKARRALLGRLLGSLGAEAAAVTVVFDAARAPAGLTAEEDYQGIRVRYTLGREADDLIEDLIRQDPAPRHLTVISDDRRLREAARRRHCPVVGCLDYLEGLQQRRRLGSEPQSDPPAKPDRLSPAETRRWLEEFADVERDPKLREAFDPGFFDRDGG